MGGEKRGQKGRGKEGTGKEGRKKEGRRKETGEGKGCRKQRGGGRAPLTHSWIRPCDITASVIMATLRKNGYGMKA